MRSHEEQFCDTGYPSPACDPSWSGFNSYELGLNNHFEILPASFYDPNLNPYVRHDNGTQLTVPLALLNNDTASNTDLIKSDSNTMTLPVTFNFSHFIAQHWKGLALTLVVGYLVIKK